jgi:hypothetical protein
MSLRFRQRREGMTLICAQLGLLANIWVAGGGLGSRELTSMRATQFW